MDDEPSQAATAAPDDGGSVEGIESLDLIRNQRRAILRGERGQRDGDALIIDADLLERREASGLDGRR